MNDLDRDLKARCRPSDDQVTQADTWLTSRRAGNVWTGLVLCNKEFGVWTKDVRVVHVDGVFLSRDAASDAVEAAAKAHHEATGEPTTGCYTWHPGPGEWSVFEDILVRFPNPDRES